MAPPVGYLPGNKQNAVSSWTSCTENGLKGIHRPVSLLCWSSDLRLLSFKTRADMSLICLVSVVVLYVFWVVLWLFGFGSFALFGQVHFHAPLM